MDAQSVERRAAPDYRIVFAILGIFTVFEVGVGFLPGLPSALKVGILAVLAVVKVALVLLYFMHLKFDRPLFAMPFALGMVLIVPLVLIVSLTIHAAPINESGDSENQVGSVNNAGQVVDVKEVSFMIHLSQDHLQAGPVTFHVVNGADDMLHEFILIQTDQPASELPTDMSGRVGEDEVTIIKAAEDIPPSQSKNIDVNLAAGHYVAICNLPGHYQQGMRVDITVTGTSSVPPSAPESTPVATPTAEPSQ